MRTDAHGWTLRLVVAFLLTAPGWAAEEVEPAATTSAPTAQGEPVLDGKALSDLLPAGTLLCKTWPGIDAYAEASKDTALAKLLKEPELQRLRTAWWDSIWPAIDEHIGEEIPDPTAQAAYQIGKSLLATVWKHPTAVALIGLDMGEAGPRADAAIIVRAGKEAARLSDTFEKLLDTAHLAPETAEKVTVGDMQFRQLAIPGVPLRWGTAKDFFIASIGTKATEHLAAGSLEDSLTSSPRFAAAVKHTAARDDSPFFYLDVQGLIRTVESFQPMLAGLGIKMLAEPGAVKQILKEIGVDSCESVSLTMVPEAGGFRTSLFVHMPGASQSANPLIGRKALNNDDFGIVPKNVRWATIANWDIAATYRSVLDMVGRIMPGGNQVIAEAIETAERRIGLSIEKEILGAFTDNWVVFDSPEFGGIWFSGIVAVAKVKPNNQLSKAMRNVAAAIAEEVGDDISLDVASEQYRGQKIEYLNVTGMPIPIAPAWAEYQGRWIVALYPQMVRMELDHLMNRGPSLLENPDFKRGRALMPKGAYSVTYVDTKAGMQQLYSFALPLWQMAAAMLQKEDIPIDVGMMPAAQTFSRHLFGNVSASTSTEDGLLTVSHGSMPIALPAIGEGGFAIPLGVSILLPSLARARELAKRTTSVANLSGIGRAMYTYAAENDDKFPPDLRTLVDNESISEKMLRSPTDHSDATVSYVYIEGQTTEVDARNILAYENPENYDNEGTAVLFVDSHVEFMPLEAFREALEDTYRRLGRDMPGDNSGQEAKKSPTSDDSPVDAAKSMVGRSGSLTAAIDLFKMNVGRYPKNLKELTEEPKEEAAAEKWQGPYVKTDPSGSIKDPWGRDIRYRLPGQHNAEQYDVWSVGPDGRDGTEDDIGNWKSQ